MTQVREIYSLRKSFSIIGITGRMSSGCSEVSKLMSQTKYDYLAGKGFMYRDCDTFDSRNEDFEIELFKRKFSIVQKYCEANWKSYCVIEYRKVLFFYLIDLIKKEKNPIEAFADAIIGLFSKSEEGLDEDLTQDYSLNREIIIEICTKNNLQRIVEELCGLEVDIKDVRLRRHFTVLRSTFYTPSFDKLFDDIISHLHEKNYYLKVFLFHKLGIHIRAFNSHLSLPDEKVEVSNVYNVARLINKLIKTHNVKNNNNCHVVIDGLKNSLEIMFFKERYSAFYMMSIHNEEGQKLRLSNKVVHEAEREVTIEKSLELDAIEHDSSSFSKGQFYSPDVENCIQKSEIHIRYIEKVIDIDKFNISGEALNDFCTIVEQLMKVQALIQQPGIITPTGVERCMQIAFNSKFNSGCISRQVGAVITDGGKSVKSVGWNDTPKNTITCLLRNTDEIYSGIDSIAYSKFENKGFEFKYEANKKEGTDSSGGKTKITLNSDYIGRNFAANVAIEEKNRAKNVKADGKNCSFCFKSLHNKFEGEKNQVHTRSLHAEENAMLQISKFGGQQVKGGFLFTTASPCELCAKKAYQLGIAKVYYIDKYPGISRNHILATGTACPDMIAFTGVIGKAFNKMYEPLMSYKDELSLYSKD